MEGLDDRRNVGHCREVTPKIVENARSPTYETVEGGIHKRRVRLVKA